jgi:hypothetical protein
MGVVNMKVLTVNLTLAFALFTTGCALIQPSGGTSCDDIVDAPVLLINPASLVGEEASRRWVTSTFGTRASGLQWARHSDGRHSLNWLVDGDRDYNFQLDSNERGSLIGVRWMRSRPVVADLLRCLGAPQAYRAMYKTQPGGVYTESDFAYLNRGIGFGSYERGRKSVGKDTGVSAFVIGTPDGSIEALNSRLMPRDATQWERDHLPFKPWPGSVDQIEIDDTTK